MEVTIKDVDVSSPSTNCILFIMYLNKDVTEQITLCGELCLIDHIMIGSHVQVLDDKIRFIVLSEEPAC